MDYVNWYRRISAPFRNETSVATINVLDRALVIGIAAAYAIAMALIIAGGDQHFWKFLFIPAITLVGVTALRDRIDAPRPYEMYDIDPIIVKHTQGKSFPSRHLTCAVIIAFALAWLHLDWGIVAFAACAIVAFTRIVGGVHFPRDIAVAAAIGFAMGLIGFVLIP